MNAITQHTPQASAPLALGLVPRNMGEAMDLAQMMAKGRLVPQHLQNSPADCLMVVEQAMRWNVSPFAVAQCTSVVSGKLMYEGKLVAGVINSSPKMQGSLNYIYSGEGDTRTVTVTGTINRETEAREVVVRLKDAKTNNRMWQIQPDQQLAYHGARVWSRRHMPEVMLGIYSPEEFPEDRQDSGPRHVENLARPEPPPAGSMREEAARIVSEKAAGKPLLTAELTVREVAINEWWGEFGATVEQFHDLNSLNEWWLGMEPMIAGERTKARAAGMVTEKRAALAEGGAA